MNQQTQLTDPLTDLNYVHYSPDVEVIEDDEPETIRKIIDAMANGGRITQEKHGRYVRVSHAKPYGLVKGELRVLEDLPEHLRQGLFREPKTYSVVARLAHAPSDLTDDRKLSAPRGMALKIIGVSGLKLPQHDGETTQDFVLDTGKIFNAIGQKTFLAQIKPVESLAGRLPEAVKGAISNTSRVANEALNAVGLNSSALDFFGHPYLHPLGEAYFSQVPMRYGEYIAKLGVVPDRTVLQSVIDKEIDPPGYDGLQTIVTDFFANNPAEFIVAVQLCTDLETMPVENANKEWPEDQSPYQPVARLRFPVQDALTPARLAYIDERLSFSPAHSLVAMRPLGGIMRARLEVYEVISRIRREQNGSTPTEPRSIDEVPD